MNLVTLNTRPFIALENGMTKYKKGDLIVAGDTKDHTTWVVVSVDAKDYVVISGDFKITATIKGVDGNPYVVLVSDVFRDSI